MRGQARTHVTTDSLILALIDTPISGTCAPCVVVNPCDMVGEQQAFCTLAALKQETWKYSVRRGAPKHIWRLKTGF